MCVMHKKIFYCKHTLPFSGGQQVSAGIRADFVPRKEGGMEPFD